MLATLVFVFGSTGGRASAVATPPQAPPPAADAAATEHNATGFAVIKTLDQVLCQPFYDGGFLATYFTRGECTRIDFTVTNTGPTSAVEMRFIGPDGTAFDTRPAENLGGADWHAVYKSDPDWPAGIITAQVMVDADTEPAGEASYVLNGLVATVVPQPKADGTPYAPGDAIAVSGEVSQVNDVTAAQTSIGVPASFKLRLRSADGDVLYTERPHHRRERWRLHGDHSRRRYLHPDRWTRDRLPAHRRR